MKSEEAKEGPATSDGRYVLVCGKSVFKDNTAQEAETFARVLNEALSPLVRRAELAERMEEALRYYKEAWKMEEALRYYKEAWKEVVNHPHHLNTGCGVCIVDRGMMAHQALTAWDAIKGDGDNG